MIAKDRYEEYKDEAFDTIMLKIMTGTIKCGRYASLVKVDKNVKYPNSRKEYFNDTKNNN